MTSTRDAARRLLIASLGALALEACGLERPPDPPPLDCAAIDRAAERFPDECADAGPDPDAGTEADAGGDDASADDAAASAGDGG